MKGHVLLRIVIAVCLVVSLIGAIVLAVHFNDVTIFYGTMSGVVSALVMSYIFGIWGDPK
jgi:hypothetical protein